LHDGDYNAARDFDVINSTVTLRIDVDQHLLRLQPFSLLFGLQL